MASKKQKQFKPSVSAEAQFSKALRKVARASAHIVEAHVDGHLIHKEREMQEALAAYAKLIEPWAIRQSKKMLEKVEKQNSKAYKRTSKVLGELIKENVSKTTAGDMVTVLMNEHVGLIKSIPLEAGLRAQKLAQEAAFNGSRAADIAEELRKTTGVTESRAVLIARTEVARATSTISEVRARAVGAHQYRWRNSGDEAVRESHKKYKGKKLDGMIFSYDEPPHLDDGTTGNPGTFPNCRCYAEPVFDEE